MRIRRLRILGVALGLSFAAAALGVALYLLPPAVGSPVNRVADFVVVNDAKRWGSPCSKRGRAMPGWT